jgi:hypothetical protein
MVGKEKFVSNSVLKSTLLLVCLVSLCLPLFAQSSRPQPDPDRGGGGSSCLNMSIGVSPAVTSPGAMVGEFALVTNCSSSRVRTTVSLWSMSPCGIKSMCGSHKLVLDPNETIQVTCSWPVPTNACLGLYTVTISAGSGQSASTTLAVQ